MRARGRAGVGRVHVECELPGRTKACPAFIVGIIDANKVLLSSPRANAEVVVYVAATPVALKDQLHLRLVGLIPGAPAEVEVDVLVDTRMTDDDQRDVIEPTFLRAIALFVGARFPDAVAVALSRPVHMETQQPDTSPWAMSIILTGNGSYTEKYRALAGQLDFKQIYLAKRFRVSVLESASGGLNQQPSLLTSDGLTISLNTTQWQFMLGGEAIALLSDSTTSVSSNCAYPDPSSAAARAIQATAV